MVVFSLTLVRHGETTANQDGVIQGHQDVALSEVGFEQAHLVALRLQGDTFTHIFSSDLSRAAQTAQAIADANPCTCSIKQDKRLRERKFGKFEGKTFTELFEEAKNHNKKWTDYVPEGGETYNEVRVRAECFFWDLCKEIAKIDSPLNDPNIFTCKLQQGFCNGTQQEGERLHEVQARQEAATIISPRHLRSVDEGVSSKRARTEETGLHRLSLDREDSDRDSVFCEEMQSVRSMLRSNSSSSSGCSSLHESLEADSPLDADHSPTAADRDGSHRAGLGSPRAVPRVGLTASVLNSPLPNGVHNVCVPNSSNKAGPGVNINGRSSSQSRRQVDITRLGNQSPVRWHADTDTAQSRPRNVLDRPGKSVPSYQACPNVSLSPMLDHRLTSISSVSSGRNSSFDDADMIPPVAANVLVVSHGGLLKMLLSHFIEDLHCKVPGGKGHALRVCPNTGVSRFMVTLDGCPGKELRPTVTCLMINDKDHLRSMPFSGPQPSGLEHPFETPAV